MRIPSVIPHRSSISFGQIPSDAKDRLGPRSVEIQYIPPERSRVRQPGELFLVPLAVPRTSRGFCLAYGLVGPG